MNANWIESLWLVTDDLCLRWLVTLLHFLWQGATIGAVAIIGTWLLRFRSASSRYVLNVVAMASLPFCVTLTFSLVGMPDSWPRIYVKGETVRTVLESSVFETVETLPRVDPIALDSAAKPVSNGLPDELYAAQAHVAAQEAGHLTEGVIGSRLTVRIAPLFVMAYVVGVLACLMRLVAAVWGGRQLRKMANPVDDPRLLELIAEQSRRVGLRVKPVVVYCEKS